jgi:hypothetical protein
MKFNIRIDKKLLALYAGQGRNGGALTRALRTPIGAKIEGAQDNLVKKFLADPISQEILGGPGVMNNPSGTLGGYGGLFSFIGFYREDSPVDDVVSLLLQPINFKLKSIGNSKFEISTDFVSKDELLKKSSQMTPIPWNSGRSWLDAIEHGISGLGQYLNTSKDVPGSFSGRGLQIKANLRGGKFQNRAYISKYLSEFEKEIKK